MGQAPRYGFDDGRPGPSIHVAGHAYPVRDRLTWRNFFKDMDAEEMVLLFGGIAACVVLPMIFAAIVMWPLS